MHIVDASTYGTYLAAWAARAKAAGYFDSVWNGDEERDGFALEVHTNEAIDAYAASPTGLDYRG